MRQRTIQAVMAMTLMIARTMSNTFAGIRPDDAPLFIVAQLAGALAATFAMRTLMR